MYLLSFVKYGAILGVFFLLISCGSDNTSYQEAPSQFDLAINFNDGSLALGSINIQPKNISCESNCINNFTAGTPIEINAKPIINARFIGWSGACTGTSRCEITLDNDKVLNAQFSVILPELTLTVKTNEGGSISFDNGLLECTNSCEYNVAQGEQVILTPKPMKDHVFIGWVGACTGNSPCEITINSDTNVRADFVKANLSPLPINTITIAEPHGIDQTNYPIQIGRPFIRGEIANFPQLVYNDIEIPTQSDVKQRHNDGSVKHAIISFILPSLSANSSKTFTFINKKNSNNTPQTKEEILSNSGFNAHMSFSFPTIATISAKDMIISDHFKYWLKGPIATSILLADHSKARIYDVGNDTYKSIRAMFHITFWPTINKYSVRYIAEAINSEALQDQLYDLSLSIKTESNIVYQRLAVPHQARSRWTKKFWSGEELETLSIDHNLSYLVRTKSIPNFDISRTLSQESIENYWASWSNQQKKDLFEKGLWQPLMSTAGGRPDIGIYPTWTVKWLYSGDWRLQEIALKQSELAAAWPIHIREGDTGRKFDFSGKIDAIGKILSMSHHARPTHWIDRPQWHEINESDKIYFLNVNNNPRDWQNYQPIGGQSNQWLPDTAHHPDIASPQYLLTGDYFFLEEMLFSSAFVSSDNNAKGFSSTLGRGPTGAEGALYSGETRGQGWALRTRVHTYDILPDNFPEKNYFHKLNQNAISMFEGLQALPLTDITRQSLYDFVRNDVSITEFKKTHLPSRIGQWDEGVSSSSYVKATDMDIKKVNQAIAPWMQNFIVIALGRAKELGYRTDTLLEFSGKPLLTPFGTPDLPYAMINALAMPTLNNNDNWFTSWVEIYAQFTPDYITKIENFVINDQDAEHGYPAISMAAASYLKGYTHHSELWRYIERNIASKTIFNHNPKWALVPRVEP
ncbi:MAG TPA: hypothetical protein DEO86_05395 [Colwellia sp.]|jgi:hypothetical protein|nr:hypothetical protein [Colwellia sp.]|tara:strand:+ start:435 stop:3191 length:2757 start_codon:yes stop_codon:yes gene_type:complete